MPRIDLGEGLKNYLAANDDHAIAYHQWEDIRADDGQTYKVERVLGTKGLYVATNLNGQWESAGPLPVAV